MSKKTFHWNPCKAYVLLVTIKHVFGSYVYHVLIYWYLALTVTSIMEPDLPQGAGYAIIIGLGLFFALLMNLITWIQNKYTKTHSDNVDEFTTSSRNVPFGLICCGIVSSWTWSLTLLQSATES